MPLTITSKQLVNQVRKLATERGVKPETYLAELVSREAPTRNGESPKKQPFYAAATTEEWIAAVSKWAASHSTATPLISDEALRRENLYDDRGL